MNPDKVKELVESIEAKLNALKAATADEIDWDEDEDEDDDDDSDDEEELG